MKIAYVVEDSSNLEELNKEFLKKCGDISLTTTQMIEEIQGKQIFHVENIIESNGRKEKKLGI
uniref:Uncharacterized protein n=1 Tax=Cucumis melo TaxID=3656 RepID=A0A9I9EJX1_CUCME